MAKRRRFSRWRRLPGVYRSGEEKLPDPNLELQRLTLYVTGHTLDRAQAQADRRGFESVQDFCGSILSNAVDAEHVRAQVAEFEAKRGTLEGLHEISDDPEYLAELSAASAHREYDEPHLASPPVPETEPLPFSVRIERRGDADASHEVEAVADRQEGESGVVFLPEHAERSTPARQDWPVPVPVPVAAVDDSNPTLSAAAQVVLRHAGQAGDDPYTFLPALRRGETVAPGEVAELAQALQQLEREFQGARAMDRRLTFALHRLAFESQILHTDAWPGSFDVWTVDMLRAVQEAVERILSGQDIRYYPDLDPATLTRPEAQP